MTVWRWQRDLVPGTPNANMAADARLLSEVLEGASPVFRIYTWDCPCVTVGRLQDEASVRSVFPDLPLVRRPTGGLAVRHGADITLTVAACLSDLPPAAGTRVLSTYQLIAGCLADAFCALEVPAGFRQGRERTGGRVDCFASAAGCDLVNSLTGAKLAGCAQRRQRSALLQQMSVPLSGIPDLTLFLHHVRQSATKRLGAEWQS